jgi:ribosome-associated protein YbcJ (S4-like RNA binding protein)
MIKIANGQDEKRRTIKIVNGEVEKRNDIKITNGEDLKEKVRSKTVI